MVPLGYNKKPLVKWKCLQSAIMPTGELAKWGNADHPKAPGHQAHYNYAVITGSYSGVVVVDADSADAVGYVEKHLPTPVRVRSSKGYHFYYRHPRSGDIIPNWQNSTVNGGVSGVDLRGDGGYVVGPGSVHSSGAVYSAEGWDQWAKMPTYDPTWLVPDVKESKTRITPETCAAVDGIELDSRQHQAREYLSTRPGTTQGRGADNRCFAIACDVIHGFALTPDEALPVFQEWGEKDSQCDSGGAHCPWTEAQLVHKLENASGTEPKGGTAGYKLKVDPTAQLEAALGVEFAGDVAKPPVPISAGGDDDAKKAGQYDRLAQRFFKAACERRRYPLFTGGQTYFYQECRYVPCREIKMRLREHFTKSGVPQSNSVVENVTPIFQSYCWKDSDAVGDMPFWAGDKPPFKDAKHVIAYRNGLLDTANIGGGLIPHSPSWCSVSCLPFGFDPAAECPLWSKFLAEVFQGDGERIATLQEYVGYCLTADTSLQKALMLVGKPRSGKGTIQRLIGELAGKDNSTGYNLDSLTTDFGMAGLVNKSVALVGEVEINARDAKRILERWKSIIGEDVQKVERKYLDAISCRLPTRFVVAANGLPRFMDASGAMANRLLWLPFDVSFFGKEDTDLEGKLVAELPGIANWGIDGLKRLRANKGKFTVGKASKKIELKYQCETSPVAAWLDACCDIDFKGTVARDAAYASYCGWCDDVENEASTNVWFARDLRTQVPHLSDGKVCGIRVYKGLALK